MCHKFYLGNTLEILKHLPEKSVQCCPTSPPYFGLRDYDLPPTDWPEVEYIPMAGLSPIKLPAWRGCLGLEPTPELYIAHLVLIYREIWRVLRDDGTCFLNLGDSYARGKPKDTSKPDLMWSNANSRKPVNGLKQKDLLGIPWRLAFALQADGWYLRSDIIWEKPNAMPESVTDRPTKSHEYMFLLAKSEKYYYDADAIRQPYAEKTKTAWGCQFKGRGDGTGRVAAENFSNSIEKHRPHPRGANKRTVWHIPTRPFRGAHYAVFPPDLIEPCILAGTSPQACPVCGAPWKRLTKKTGHVNKREVSHCLNNTPTKIDSTGWAPTSTGTDEFKPACNCVGNDGSGKSIVLDPFGGSGTVNIKAKELSRDSIYIDMSPNYLGDALRRGKYASAEYDIV